MENNLDKKIAGTPDRGTSQGRPSTGSTITSMRRMAAVKLADVVAKLEKQNASDEEIAGACGFAGAAYYREGEYGLAEKYLNEALTRYQLVDGKENEMGQVYTQLGLVYTEQGNYDYAENYFQEALGIFSDTSSKERANILSKLGQMYRRQGENYPSAFKNLSDALAIYSTLQSKADIADTRYQLGLTYAAQNEHALAVEAFSVALTFFGDAYTDEVAETCFHLGMAFEALSRSEDAILQLQRANDVYTRLSERNEDLARVQQQIGFIYFNQNRYQEAMAAFSLAVGYLQNMEGLELADVLYLKGMTAVILKQDEVALAALNTSLPLYQMLNDDELYNPKIVLTYEQLGLVYQRLGNHEYAIGFFNQALELCNKKMETAEEARVHRRLGESYIQNRVYDMAEESLTQARSICQNLSLADELGVISELFRRISVAKQASTGNNSSMTNGATSPQAPLSTTNQVKGSSEDGDADDNCCIAMLKWCGLWGTSSPQQRKASKEIPRVDAHSPLVEHLTEGDLYGATTSNRIDRR